MNAINLSQVQNRNPDFLDEVIQASGENIRKCYVCGKCSAGCPMAFAMDIPPNRIARMLQLGMKDAVLNSKTIWLCLTCGTCGARCPKDIYIGAVHDTLRIMAYKAGITSHVKNDVLFHDVFLNSILRHGRLYELGMIMGLTLGSKKLLADSDLGPATLMRGKLHFLPPRVKGAGALKKIAENVKRLEGEH